jgi:hypothetical protein
MSRHTSPRDHPSIREKAFAALERRGKSIWKNSDNEKCFSSACVLKSFLSLFHHPSSSLLSAFVFLSSAQARLKKDSLFPFFYIFLLPLRTLISPALLRTTLASAEKKKRELAHGAISTLMRCTKSEEIYMFLPCYFVYTTRCKNEEIKMKIKWENSDEREHSQANKKKTLKGEKRERSRISRRSLARPSSLHRRQKANKVPRRTLKMKIEDEPEENGKLT